MRLGLVRSGRLSHKIVENDARVEYEAGEEDRDGEEGDTLGPVENLEEGIHPDVVSEGDVQHPQAVGGHGNVKQQQAALLRRKAMLSEHQFHQDQHRDEGVLRP